MVKKQIESLKELEDIFVYVEKLVVQQNVQDYVYIEVIQIYMHK